MTQEVPVTAEEWKRAHAILSVSYQRERALTASVDKEYAKLKDTNDAMRAALQDIAQIAQNQCNYHNDIPKGAFEAFDYTANIARAAIARAKGE